MNGDGRGGGERVTRRSVRRFDGLAVSGDVADSIAVEEPLEIRVAGETLAVTMRTPGADRFLAVGFLFAEGVIASLAEVGEVRRCARLDDPGYPNSIDVLPAPGVVLDPTRLARSRREAETTASCGVCGRRSIDDLAARIGPVRRGERVHPELLCTAPEALTSAQQAFPLTGGVHAAMALAADGTGLANAEDVGRHNAVDKVVGQLLYDGQLEQTVVLVVSGRVSFEIVQKAATARIPCIAAVSAPTSLAVDLAIRADITLAAFVRGGRMNVYSGHGRLVETR